MSKLNGSSGTIVTVSTRVARRQLYSLNANPLPDLEDIPVVRDFPDVFPEELPGGRRVSLPLSTFISCFLFSCNFVAFLKILRHL